MAVSETIVREFFELHGFFVRQNRKHIAPKREDDEVDFYVHNPNGSAEESEVPFVLESATDLASLSRAVVVVKAWHTEVFTQAVLAHAPEMFRFAGPETLETKIFGRLSAWQNWIFQRPNAVGEDGALKLFGTGKQAKFDRKRV